MTFFNTAARTIIVAAIAMGLNVHVSAKDVDTSPAATLKAELKAINAEKKLAKVEFDNSAAGQAELRAKIDKAREALAKIKAKTGAAGVSPAAQ